MGFRDDERMTRMCLAVVHEGDDVVRFPDNSGLQLARDNVAEHTSVGHQYSALRTSSGGRLDMPRLLIMPTTTVNRVINTNTAMIAGPGTE